MIILNIAYIFLMQLLIARFVATDRSEEVCDIEGSGIDDCPDQCCNPSVCYDFCNPDHNPDKRFCTKEEWNIWQNGGNLPSDCTPCTFCCDETERKAVPLPKYCSKCIKC